MKAWRKADVLSKLVTPRAAEGVHRLDPGDAEQVQFGVALQDVRDPREAREDLTGLERHHAAERDALVAQILECA